jgi:hypothetical protein
VHASSFGTWNSKRWSPGIKELGPPCHCEVLWRAGPGHERGPRPVLLCPREDLNICLPMGSKTDVRGYAFLGTSCNEFCSPYVSLCVYVCIYIYVYVCIYIIIYKYTFVYINTHTCLFWWFAFESNTFEVGWPESSYVGTSLVLSLKKLNLPLHLLGSTCQARPRVETNSEALGHCTNVDQGPL